jgi:predicted enzyme related to lactoylglutathione lyase
MTASFHNLNARQANRVSGAEVGSTIALAEKLGGRVLVAPKPELFDGKVALIADPNGAVFGVLQWAPVGTDPPVF